MNFQDAVMTCLTKKYVDFNGRAGKAEFWWFVLFYFVVYVVLAVVGGMIHIPLIVLMLGLILPYLAVAVRRLHDTNRSGWMYLIGLIPLVGIILLIVWWVGDGTVGDNQYGADPRGGTAGATPAAPTGTWAS